MAEVVVKLLKPDNGGHMARIFSAYSWRSGRLEILGQPQLAQLVRDLTQYNASGSTASALNEEDLFLVRALSAANGVIFPLPASPPSPF